MINYLQHCKLQIKKKSRKASGLTNSYAFGIRDSHDSFDRRMADSRIPKASSPILEKNHALLISGYVETQNPPIPPHFINFW